MNFGNTPISCQFMEFSLRGEYDYTDFSIAKQRQFPGLLEQPLSALAEGYPSVGRVLNSSHPHLPSDHGFHSACRLPSAWTIDEVTVVLLKDVDFVLLSDQTTDAMK